MPKDKRAVQSPIAELDESFSTLRLSDIEKFKPNPKDIIVGDGFFRKGAGALLIGGTGLGKSVLAEQIAVSLACGIPILGKLAVRRPTRTLVIQAENDMMVLKRDIPSIVGKIGADRALVQKNLVIRHVPGVPPEMFGPWLDSVVRREKPEFMVLDPYQAFLGDVDMNRTDSFLKWMPKVNTLLLKYRFGILIVTHTPKPQERKGWTDRDYVYLAMGSSTMVNWIRSSCELIPLKEPNRFSLHFSKCAEWTGLTQNGSIVRNIYIEHSGDIRNPYWKLSGNQSDPIKFNIRGMVEKLAKKKPKMSQGEIARSLGISKSTVNEYYPGKKK